jgi:hypothetical protein
MATKTLQVTCQTDVAYLISTTYYWSTADVIRDSTSEVTEANTQITYNNPGRLSNLTMGVFSNTVTAASTIRTRKNGANGSQSISVGSSATGLFQDTTNSDTVAATDKINYQLVVGGTGTSITVRFAATNFTATTGTVIHYAAASSAGIAYTTASATRYELPAPALSGAITTETDVKIKIKQVATWRNLYAYVSANTWTTATTITSRKNAAGGNMSVSVGITTTGIFEDTSNSDSIAVDDYINFALTTGAGSGSLTLQQIASELFNVDKWTVIASAAAPISQSSNQSQWPFGGTPFNGGGTTPGESKSGARMNASNLWVFITANTAATATGYYLVINDFTTLLVASVGAGLTGQFEDTTDVVAIIPSDNITMFKETTNNISIKAMTIMLQGFPTVFPPIPRYQQAINRASTY